MMITKEELKEHYKLACEIKDLQEEIKQLQSVAKTAGAVNYGSFGSGSGGSDTIGEKLAKLNDLMEYYVLKVEESMEHQRHIESEIEHLPVNERRLIRYRYIDGLHWVQVASKMNYSLEQTYRIHGSALLKLKHDTK